MDVEKPSEPKELEKDLEQEEEPDENDWKKKKWIQCQV
jgi:hypothetical protein